MHIKKIFRNEAANGFNPMTGDEFRKNAPWGWVELKDGSIAVFAGVKTPAVFPDKNAAADVGYVLNEVSIAGERKGKDS